MGTGHQSNITLNAGKVVCRLIAACKGWEYRSKLVNNMAAGGYEKQFQSATDGSSWLSRNPESVRKYKNDPLCSFIFTVNAYYNLFCGMLRMNRQENAGKIPMTLPVLFVAGKEDPVGNSGKGVEKVCQAYRNRGMNHVEIKMYAGARHEILNEYGKEQAYEDILNWLEKRICK